MRKAGSPFTIGLLACALLATILRAARFPNDFSRAHWMLDYRFGFIKRGLAGSVLALLARVRLIPQNGVALAWLSFALFGLLCAVLLVVAARILARRQWSADAYLPLAAFATSPFVVTAAHLMGYLDHLVFVLTFAAVWLIMRDRRLAAGACGAVAMLVHESFMVIGLPLVALAAAVRTPLLSWRSAARTLLPPLAPPILAFTAVVVSEWVFIDRATLRHQLVERLSSFPFIGKDMNIFVPEWLTTTLSENLQQAHSFTRRVGNVEFEQLIMPTAIVLWLLALTTVGRRRAAAWAVSTAAVIAAPLLLHAVAWDTARIWTYPLFAALGCAWIAAETTGVQRPPRWPILGLLACPVIYWNLFARYPLLDHEVDRFSDAERLAVYAPFLIGSVIAVWLMRSGSPGAPQKALPSCQAGI